MKKETLPTELVVVVLFSIVGFIMLFAALTGSERPSVQGNLMKSVLQDKVLDEQELEVLSGMSCESIRAMLGTDRNVCIYMKDLDGNIVDVGDSISGFGCPGITVDGSRICG